MKNTLNLIFPLCFTLCSCSLYSQESPILFSMCKKTALISFDSKCRVLEVHGDSIDIDLSITFPENYFKKGAIMEMTPYMTYSDGEVQIKGITLAGEGIKKKKEAIEISSTGKQTIQYKNKISYSDLYKTSSLEMEIKIMNDSGNVRCSNRVFVVPGTITTSLKADLSDDSKGFGFIKTGDYPSAVKFYNGKNTFNSALALLLVGDCTSALKIADAIKDQTPELYYLKAIIGARVQNTTVMFENLGKACSKNPKYINEAKSDMEFIKFFEDEEFKRITH